MQFRRPQLGLLRDHDFRQLFVADTISQLGTQVSQLALPLVAVVTLRASEFEVGLLVTLEFLAFLLVGLPAGAWVDRLRRRNVLIAGDVGRAVLLGSVPLAWWAGALTIWQLYVVALLVGVLTVFFDVAYQSYLPHLAGPGAAGGGVSCCRVSARWYIPQVSVSGRVGAAGRATTKPVRYVRTLRRQVRYTGTGSASGTRPVRVERTWRACKTRTCPGCGRRSVNLAPRQRVRRGASAGNGGLWVCVLTETHSLATATQSSWWCVHPRRSARPGLAGRRGRARPAGPVPRRRRRSAPDRLRGPVPRPVGM